MYQALQGVVLKDSQSFPLFCVHTAPLSADLLSLGKRQGVHFHCTKSWTLPAVSVHCSRSVYTIRNGMYFRATAITRKFFIGRHLIRFKVLLIDGISCSLESHLEVILKVEFLNSSQSEFFRVMAVARKYVPSQIV